LLSIFEEAFTELRPFNCDLLETFNVTSLDVSRPLSQMVASVILKECTIELPGRKNVYLIGVDELHDWIVSNPKAASLVRLLTISFAEGDACPDLLPFTNLTSLCLDSNSLLSPNRVRKIGRLLQQSGYGKELKLSLKMGSDDGGDAVDYLRRRWWQALMEPLAICNLDELTIRCALVEGSTVEGTREEGALATVVLPSPWKRMILQHVQFSDTPTGSCRQFFAAFLSLTSLTITGQLVQLDILKDSFPVTLRTLRIHLLCLGNNLMSDEVFYSGLPRLTVLETLEVMCSTCRTANDWQRSFRSVPSSLRRLLLTVLNLDHMVDFPDAEQELTIFLGETKHLPALRYLTFAEHDQDELSISMGMEGTELEKVCKRRGIEFRTLPDDEWPEWAAS
jgi:hypothetical protein